ncbi:ribosome maturation factor RimM [Acholeplasma hippikon]|nr:ribosome maturation factor RimM [Acholeplasma hippikon]
MMLYSIGKIVTTHGIKGEVKVLPDTDFNRFVKGAVVIVNGKELTINTVRTQNEYFLVSFEGYPTLTEVETLRGFEVFTKEEPTELGENEYHLPALIGLPVYTMDNTLVGEVDSVLELPQGHLLRVLTTEKKKVLIPFVKEFIKTVSDDGIWIDVIEGLL